MHVLILLVAGALVGAQPPGRPQRVTGPRRAIVDASFVAADAATDQVHGNELVLGVVVAGAARAYPINMLTGPSREIVNDTVAGRAIAATW